MDTAGWRWRLDLLRSADGDGDDDVGDDVEGSKKTRLRTPDQVWNKRKPNPSDGIQLNQEKLGKTR